MEFLSALKVAIFDIFSYPSVELNNSDKEKEPRKSPADPHKVNNAKKELQAHRSSRNKHKKSKAMSR
ncbi:hypothetical protein BGP75_22125 [Motiliproteus sp. MSK22-1]|nr:hypothetical protein BGP75_22125 [Motiliproteus sp. MSK22-1]